MGRLSTTECTYLPTYLECLKLVNDGGCLYRNIDIKGNSMLSGAALTKFPRY